ncbi:hypothetical protein D5086_020673 [Populus alba]|uniref:Uncharacterized protein n=1 Tax=Populus alba TaxID=43335 RepID=A0ACC4BL35_POPAL
MTMDLETQPIYNINQDLKQPHVYSMKATKEAGAVAGLNVLRIVTEPIVDAMAYDADELERMMKKLEHVCTPILAEEQGEGQKLESIPGRCTCPLEFRDMAELR